MKYNHVSFNEKWASSVPEEAFIEQHRHVGLSKKQLKEVYRLIKVKDGDNKAIQETGQSDQSTGNITSGAGSNVSGIAGI